jgi:hypothetical protein
MFLLSVSLIFVQITAITREHLKPGSAAPMVRMPPPRAVELEVQKPITARVEAVITCWAMELDYPTAVGLAMEVRNKNAGAHRHHR